MKKQTSVDRYLKGGRILSNYFYTDYIKKYLNRNKKTRCYPFTRDDYRHIMKDVFEEIGKQMVESDCGVHMKGMGYFYIFTTITPYLKSPKNAPKKIMYDRLEVNGRRFYACFNPTKGSPFIGYSLDFCEDPKLKKKIKEKSREGKRWKMYYSNFVSKTGR